MGRVVKKIKEYEVIRIGDGFVLYNSKIGFEEAHTHLNTLQTALRVIKWCQEGKVPNINNYLLVSIMRVTSDKKQKERILNLLAVRKQKGKKETYRRPS